MEEDRIVGVVMRKLNTTQFKFVLGTAGLTQRVTRERCFIGKIHSYIIVLYHEN